MLRTPSRKLAGNSGRARRCILRRPILRKGGAGSPAVVEGMDVVVHGAHANGMVPYHFGQIGVVIKTLQRAERHSEGCETPL